SSAVQRRSPLGVALVVAAGDPEVEVADLLRDGADLTIADLASVDLHAGRDLRPGAAEEDLFGDVQLSPIDLPLFDEDAELGGELQDRVTRDAPEDVGRHRRRDKRAVAHHEQIRAAALRDVAVRG